MKIMGFAIEKGWVSLIPCTSHLRYDTPRAHEGNERMISRLIYPHPFQPSGIEFEMSEEGIVSLELIDGSGAKKDTLIQEEMYSRGTYKIELPKKVSLPQTCYYRFTVRIGGQTLVETKPLPTSLGYVRMDEKEP
jgi:hypothetical protein